jgi:hypothetical protein
MSTPRTSIKDLTKDLAEKEVAPKLELLELARLMQASKSVNALFKKPLLDRKMSAVGNYVEQANYEKLEAIAMADPTLMFNPVLMKVPGESKPVLISPLQFAFKTLDTYMWQLILKAIQHSQNQALLSRFSAELHQPITHTNLEPLFKAYDDYIKQCGLWLSNQITDQQIDQDWLALGVSQRQYLSMGMLKIFCDKNTDWRPEATFAADENKWPKGVCQIKAYYDNKGGGEETLSLDRLGISFSLVNYGRADTVAAGAPPLPYFRRALAVADLATFRRLLEVRTQDFKQLKAQQLILAPQANSCNVM